ncbi:MULTISPECIES: hypothetical protein [unclassified Delftia]|uniref:hypothetical protein n=1 Tax=unclassified Delftia TaxID=2613839 RepID=UPI000B0869EA|nr:MULTISPECIES: hypothetical protein [unclassified Delftia]MDC2860801.1 hypothetical protein [Delftia sp. DT-2]
MHGNLLAEYGSGQLTEYIYLNGKLNHRRRQEFFEEDAILLDKSKKIGTSISYERYPAYSKLQ